MDRVSHRGRPEHRKAAEAPPRRGTVCGQAERRFEPAPGRTGKNTVDLVYPVYMRRSKCLISHDRPDRRGRLRRLPQTPVVSSAACHITQTKPPHDASDNPSRTQRAITASLACSGNVLCCCFVLVKTRRKGVGRPSPFGGRSRPVADIGSGILGRGALASAADERGHRP